jgi:hypothetical protein
LFLPTLSILSPTSRSAGSETAPKKQKPLQDQNQQGCGSVCFGKAINRLSDGWDESWPVALFGARQR